MSVIKSSSTTNGIRAVPSWSAPTIAQQPSPEALALGRAEQEIVRLTRLLEDARAEAIRAERQALERGRGEGVKEATSAADKRLDAFSTILQKARADWDKQLGSVDALAVELAHAALAKVFGPTEDLGDLTLRAIRHTLSQVEQQSVITLVVSKADFPDAAALSEVAAAVEPAGATASAVPTLKAGECRLELRIGERAIGPSDQWRVLSSFLGELASEHVAA